MKFFQYFLLFLLAFKVLFASENELDNLLEKLNQTTNPQEKSVLMEKIKTELANKNKKDRQEAEAIIKAKEKIPSHFYSEPSIKK
jgi:uncharacterized protein YpuA (DUF1002 family)